jgi:hypothetical protein
MEESVDHRRDGQMRRTYSQQEVETRSKNLISRKLKRLIARYDGSAKAAKDILRGLAAARLMDIDCRPFEDALAKHFPPRNAA